MNRLIITGVLLDTKEKGFVEQNIHIYNKKIEYISSEAPDNIDKKHIPIIDGKHYMAIPGMIDVHTHVREPGLCYKENFRSASMAAAAGGVTTFFDMPNTLPATTTYQRLLEKQTMAQTSIVDYNMHFGASENSSKNSYSKEIQTCIKQHSQGKALPPSVKIFLNETTGNLTITSQEILEEIVQHAWFITAHAEEEKVETIISLTQKYNTPLYLVHISRKSEIDYIKSIKQHKVPHSSPIYVEVCPHHLAYTQDDIQQNPLLTMKPPLQTKQDREALWDAIINNMVDSIGSDHAPHSVAEKKHALHHNTAIYGVPGLETSLLYLLDAAHKGILSMQKIMALCSHNPANIFAIKHKGKIEVGYDADIVLAKIQNASTQYTHDLVISKAHWSIFNDTLFYASIGATISNGTPVFLSHDIYKKYYNAKKHTILQSNARGHILFSQGKEVTCHDK